jgi:hypothetical protein
MSIEIILIPLAVAAIGSWQAKRASDSLGARFVEVGTRMRNERLLELALHDVGAQVERHGDEISANWDQFTGRFVRDIEGIWTGHFPENMEIAVATEVVQRLDTAYGFRVQEEVVLRLQERAHDAGFQIESQRLEEDRSVTMVLAVNRWS